MTLQADFDDTLSDLNASAARISNGIMDDAIVEQDLEDLQETLESLTGIVAGMLEDKDSND